MAGFSAKKLLDLLDQNFVNLTISSALHSAGDEFA
jgi:hypothetical protein